jgi:hypothetical protein
MSIGTAHGARSLYERRDGQRVSVHDIQQTKQQGERFVMLTAYDTLVAGDLPFGAYQESAEAALAAGSATSRRAAPRQSSWKAAARSRPRWKPWSRPASRSWAISG